MVSAKTILAVTAVFLICQFAHFCGASTQLDDTQADKNSSGDRSGGDSATGTGTELSEAGDENPSDEEPASDEIEPEENANSRRVTATLIQKDITDVKKIKLCNGKRFDVVSNASSVLVVQCLPNKSWQDPYVPTPSRATVSPNVTLIITPGTQLINTQYGLLSAITEVAFQKTRLPGITVMSDSEVNITVGPVTLDASVTTYT